MLRLLYFIPTYLIFLVFRTVMILFGWLVIPPMAILKRTKTVKSMVNGRDIKVWKDWFMYPWSNDEDGVIAGEELLGKPDWIRTIYWSAIRNPANNLRFVKYLSVRINPEKVKFWGKMLYGSMYEDIHSYDSDKKLFISLVWQGIYSNFRVQFKMGSSNYRFWVGWKIYPHDRYGMLPNDYRRNGAGFATQFKKISK